MNEIRALHPGASRGLGLSVAKKTTRGQRLNESQLRAYRQRKAETVITSRPVAPVERDTAQPAAKTGMSSWGSVADEYVMIRGDLRRLLIITALMLVLLIALWLILG